MSAQPSASMGRIQVLRAATYFVAFLIASTAALLAYVSSEIVYAVFGLVIAAVLILLAHQPLSRITALTAILLILSYVVPAISVHETPDAAHCVGAMTPCTPSINSHPGLRLGLAAALLIAALITASAGQYRSSRTANARPRRLRELA